MIAAGFARIFFRNAFNVGLAVLESPEAVNGVKDGDILSVDLDLGQILNEAKGESYPFEPIPDNMKRILDAGGLIPDLMNTMKLGEECR